MSKYGRQKESSAEEKKIPDELLLGLTIHYGCTTMEILIIVNRYDQPQLVCTRYATCTFDCLFTIIFQAYPRSC